MASELLEQKGDDWSQRRLKDWQHLEPLDQQANVAIAERELRNKLASPYLASR